MDVSGGAWANSPFRFGAAAADADHFDPAQAYAYTDPRPYDARERKRVCVIGGGIAGLAAAYELVRLEHEVVLLEGSDRFGGRIRTHYFADGTYGELGAMRIPADHGCVWHYLEKFGLPTRRFLGENPLGWCLFRDAPRMRRWEWDLNWPAYYGAGARWAGRSAKDIVATDVAATTPVADSEWWESLSNGLTSRNLTRLDGMTLGQDVLGITGRMRRKLEDAVWQYTGRTAHHIWLEPTSMLHWMREGAILDIGGKFEIPGGMDLLTRAFLREIRERSPDALVLGAKVLGIALGGDGVTVSWRQNALPAVAVESFDYVICTVPAPATQRLHFDPPLPPAKREALASLSHVSAGKTIMRCSKRHWEIVDGIYGGTSVTDRANQQCWYPSDNLRAPDEGGADHLIAELELDPMRDLLDARATLVDRDADRAERSHEPGVFLAAYLWATNARRFGSLSDAERDDLIARAVAELHPANDRYLEDIVHVSWDDRGGAGGGAFAFFAPGEQRRYQAALCEPVPADGPRVFFAGEHVGILHGWIQSSIQSALSATIDVVSAP